MQWLRQLISYAVTLALIIALVVVVPRFQRLRVDPEYRDIGHLDVDQSLNGDTGFSFARLAAGDPIAYNLPGPQDTKMLGVGWIAALPGQEVGISNRHVVVDGRPAKGGTLTSAVPDRPAVPVPSGHVFVVTDGHEVDSLTYGFIPAAAIRAKLANLP